MSIESGGEHSGAILFHAVRDKRDDTESSQEICIAVNRFQRFRRWNEKAGFQRDALCSQ